MVINSVRVVGEFDRAKLEEAVKKVEAAAKAEEEKKKVEQEKLTAEFTKKIEEAKAKGVKSESGLVCHDIVLGDGPTPQAGQRVEVHYTGWLTNGTKFDSSVDRGRPFTFALGQGQVIKGWDEGVATMKVGGKRTLVIPADIAYGAGGRPPTIPPSSTLVFDVELLGIKE